MAKIIQIIKDGPIMIGLGDDGVTYEANCETKEWVVWIPGLTAKKDVAKPPVKRFKPPSAYEVAKVIHLKGIPLQTACSEADKFCNHYSSNGWKVGKNKMKCWKSAVANWMKRVEERPIPQAHKRQQVTQQVMSIGDTDW